MSMLNGQPIDLDRVGLPKRLTVWTATWISRFVNSGAWLAFALYALLPNWGWTQVTRTVVIVQGAEGAPEFAEQFRVWVEHWRELSRDSSATWHWIGVPPDIGAANELPPRAEAVAEPLDDRQQLQTILKNYADSLENPADSWFSARESAASNKAPNQHDHSELWVVMIGHGTDDGVAPKFNLRGPDVSAQELADWLAPSVERSRQIVIQTASASGAFLGTLSHSRRVVITATRNGAEVNFARFGGEFAQAWNGLAADLDKDERVSVLEAFLWASRRTSRFYSDAARLATEHSLLEDNGDRKGVAADWFVGIRVKGAGSNERPADGFAAHQIFWHVPQQSQPIETAQQSQEQQELERQIELLIQQKKDWNEDEYYRKLEKLFLRLAQLRLTPSSAENPLGNQPLISPLPAGR